MKQNRKPANPTQVRRVLDNLARGVSIRQTAEACRLSEFVVRKIKAGTYHVAPEQNKYVERKHGQPLKHRRKDTTLPADYRQQEVQTQAELQKAVRLNQQELNQRLRNHPYPDAARLLEVHDDELGGVEPDMLRAVLWWYSEPPDEPSVDPIIQCLARLLLLKRLHPMGIPEEMNDFSNIIWSTYYNLLEEGLIAHEMDEEDLQRLFPNAEGEEPEREPRWHSRARRQLKAWHQAEARSNQRPLELIGCQKRRLCTSDSPDPRIADQTITMQDIIEEEAFLPESPFALEPELLRFLPRISTYHVDRGEEEHFRTDDSWMSSAAKALYSSRRLTKSTPPRA
jgi:transcriptional regulator with XRE-family HTH domain